jgi:hypothetical protein
MSDLNDISAAVRDLDAAVVKAATVINTVAQRGPAAIGHAAYHTLHVLQLRMGEFRNGLNAAMAQLPAPAPIEPAADAVPAKGRRR